MIFLVELDYYYMTRAPPSTNIDEYMNVLSADINIF